MQFWKLRNRFRHALDLLIDSLTRSAQSQRTLLLLLAAYMLVWTVYGVVSRSAQDINADMAEMVIWSRDLALGYPKHPPFLAYVVWLWFSVFPVTDWAYMLLALFTVTAGLYLAFRLAGEWLTGHKRVAALFLLAIIPFYNFLGLKFDQNSALIPLWALTTWALIRSLKTGHAGWAVVCGVAAAAAMLTKYWSMFLLAAMAFTILADQRRNAYLRSPAPWITAAVFAALVAPHAVWLVQNDFPPLEWVSTRRMATGILDWFQGLSAFVFGTAGYAAAALIAYVLAVQPSRAILRDTLLPSEPTRRRAAILFWTPLILPVAVSAAGGTGMLSLWNAPALNLLPVVLLSSPKVDMPYGALLRIITFAIAVPLIALLAAPVVAALKLRGTENHSNYARLVADTSVSEWRRATDQPLRLMAGPFGLITTAAAYVPDRPLTFPDFSDYLAPWVDEARVKREGIAVVCPTDMEWCLKEMEALAAHNAGNTKRHEVTLRRQWLWLSSPPARFTIAIVPPAK
jgi:4-amino-4-deoxy-L-arabinose transferase-like glycosyltransferase